MMVATIAMAVIVMVMVVVVVALTVIVPAMMTVIVLATMIPGAPAMRADAGPGGASRATAFARKFASTGFFAHGRTSTMFAVPARHCRLRTPGEPI
ncbi:MAG: hypothetical protein R3D33_02270 [Hyphomicrobiaceae bacterium]